MPTMAAACPTVDASPTCSMRFASATFTNTSGSASADTIKYFFFSIVCSSHGDIPLGTQQFLYSPW